MLCNFYFKSLKQKNRLNRTKKSGPKFILFKRFLLYQALRWNYFQVKTWTNSKDSDREEEEMILKQFQSNPSTTLAKLC